MPRARLLTFALLVAALAIASAPDAAHSAFGPVGSLNQLTPGQGGCLSTPAGNCGGARGLAGGVGDLAFDSSRQNLFAPAGGATVAVLRRDPLGGALSQAAGEAGCVEPADGTSDLQCRQASNLAGARDVAVSPDDKNVYVAGTNGVAALKFTAGITTQSGLASLSGDKACMSDAKVALPELKPNTCSNGRASSALTGIAVAPDGKHVYASVNPAGTGDDGVLILARGATDGDLTQSGVAAEGCVTRNGTATGDGDNPGPQTQGCAGQIRGLEHPSDIVVSADGSTVYLAVQRGIVVFRRDTGNGRLTQLEGPAGCVSGDKAFASAEGCRVGRGVPNVSQLALSGDRSDLYAANAGAQVVAHFRVDASGALSQANDTTGCISGGGTVADGDGFPCEKARSLGGNGGDIAVSPDQRTVAVGGDAAIGEVALLDRTGSGGLTQAGDTRGCVSATGAASGVDGGNGKCRQGDGLGGSGMAYSPGADHFYAAGASSVAGFRREVAPGCEPASASTDTLTPVTVSFRCGDLNGDTVTLRVFGAPTRGALGTPQGTSIAYTPAAGASGLDTFLMTPSDGTNDGAFTTASVNVAFKAAPTPTPTPVKTPVPTGKAPAARVLTRSLRLNTRKQIKFQLECPRTAPVPCTGTVEILTRGKERVVKNKKKRRVQVFRRTKYTLAQGKRKLFTAKLPLDALRALKFKDRIALTVTLIAPAQGRLSRNTQRGGLDLVG